MKIEHISEALKELLQKAEAWKKDPTPHIGKATFDRKLNVIYLDTGLTNYRYEVDLDECKTKAVILDWIFHINQKTWASPELMKDFISMLEMTCGEVIWNK